VGLVLEDLDSFAADVATRHLGGLPHGYTVVTAAIDKLALTTAAPQNESITAAAAAAGGQPPAAGSSGGNSDKALPSGWGPQKQQQQQQGGDDDDDMALRRQLSRRVSVDVTQYPLSVHSDLRMVGQVRDDSMSLCALEQISKTALRGSPLVNQTMWCEHTHYGRLMTPCHRE
jgi:hypothetical protein